MALAPDRPSLADNLLHVEMMLALESGDLDRVQDIGRADAGAGGGGPHRAALHAAAGER